MSISLNCKSTIQLKPVNGNFVPFKSSEVPEILQSPWSMDGSGMQNAYPVGYRSAVFKEIDTTSFYKLKGCRPYDGTYFRGNSIFGALTPEKAMNELKVTGILETFYNSCDILPPHKPCGFYIYDNPIDDKTLACNVFETNGELRLGLFFNKFLELFGHDKALVNDFTLNIVEWLGFNQYSLKHCNIGIVDFEDTIDPGNYTFSKLDSGYGLFGIDHTSSELGAYHELSDSYISNIAMDTVFLNKCLIQGMSFRDFKVGTIPFYPSDDYVSKIDSILNRYYEFYDSGCVPKPLDKNIIDVVESNLNVDVSNFWDNIKCL